MTVGALKNTVFVRALAFWKIPLLYSVKPTVIALDDDRCEVRIRLRRWTKNHLNSMYFGALCIGADCAGGLIAMKQITERKANVSLVFKDFQAQFLKRPEGDVHFHCEQGREIAALVSEALTAKTRQNLPVHVTATVPSISGSEPVAKFVLTLSLKAKR